MTLSVQIPPTGDNPNGPNFNATPRRLLYLLLMAHISLSTQIKEKPSRRVKKAVRGFSRGVRVEVNSSIPSQESFDASEGSSHSKSATLGSLQLSINGNGTLAIVENGWRWEISRSQRGRFGKCYWRKNKAMLRKELAFGRPKRTIVAKPVLISGSPLPNPSPVQGTARFDEEGSISSVAESKHLSEEPQSSGTESLKYTVQLAKASRNAKDNTSQAIEAGSNFFSSGADLGASKEIELEKALFA